MALTKHCLILSGDCANVYWESYELNKYHFAGLMHSALTLHHDTYGYARIYMSCCVSS